VRLADGLLIFGEKGTTYGTTDLNTVVGECLNEFEAGLPPGIVLIPELTPNLPLVPAGRILIRTGRNTEPTDGREMAYLVVEDQGHGMDLPTTGRAIEPFFTTKAFGRGLGLSISYGIIKSVGGTLNLQSTVGGGTVVEVVLPTQPSLLSPRRG